LLSSLSSTENAHFCYLDLAQKIATVAAGQVVGNAINEDCNLGPLISAKETDRIELWVDEAIASGAHPKMASNLL
jgi:acyl-CoA reductase-like NAD-dependent aldehyde dehydrogenase